MKPCKQCNAQFEVTDSDRAFYNKMQVPEPTLCPQCRMQRRMAWRNERVLYKRNCDLCKNDMVSIYPVDVEFPVYCSTCWWGDSWEPLKYGIDFDFSKTFFEQWQKLLVSVPMPGLLSVYSENSEYAHAAGNNKNCYLVFCSSYNEDSYYSYWLQKSKNCVDCSHCNECEKCYECEECFKCYNVKYSQNSIDCLDGDFLYDCRNCQNCFMCCNLRNAKYMIRNEQYTKEEYEKKINELRLSSQKSIFELKKEFEKYKIKFPKIFQYSKNSEHCTGEYFVNSKNCKECYTAKLTENCSYSHDTLNLKDSMDVSLFGNPGEWLYEVNNIGRSASNVKFSQYGYGISFAEYTYQCYHSTELFGCVGLRQQNKFCILNKQYGELEYKQLKEKIILHMKKSGEYGEFPSAGLSLSGYNETRAQEHFPLTANDAKKLGWKWQEKMPNTIGKETLTQDKIPDDINDADESICKETLACADTGKNYKIVKQELAFYKRMNIPLPCLCPDSRHSERMSLRNPMKLWHRKCARCTNEFETTYAPERPEIILCAECYQKEVL